MRLLECGPDGGFAVTENLPDNENLEYAILSHTWGPDHEEVTFKDLADGTGKDKAGYEKIKLCAKQAGENKLRYFWVDTCCIDKSNQVELHEAINSMFRWYHKAARCYVYLSDVSVSGCGRKRKREPSEPWESAFRHSRWFKRGWTLQELIAPASVEFFTKEGQRLGDKRSLEGQIHEITGIAVQALRGADLSEFSVDERFKWAETRRTTREEDSAYCLLGIFGVFMTLIYGERKEHAIRRLRKEIDHAFNPELSFVLDKLPIADGAAFDSQAEGAAPTCHPDTRVDLLRQMVEWADQPTDQPQTRSIYWLNGMAGTGKSTISRTMARHFANQRRLGASFFFKRGDGDRGKVTKFFTTIARQLASTVPAMAVHVKNAIESDPDVVRKNMPEQFEKLIFEPLSRITLDASQASGLVIVVDALDECERDDDVKLIINLFSRVKSLTSLRLRILVTSRPELPIRLGFGAIRGKYQDLVLHEIPEPILEHDISAYLQYELDRIRDEYNTSVSEERQLSSSWPDQSTIQILVKMAVPLFIFAATVCRFVDDRICGDPDEQLQEVLKFQTRSQQSKLDATYLPVLNKLLVRRTNPGLLPLSTTEKRHILEDFQTIVGSIVVLANPLPAASLARLLDISQRRVNCRLDLLHSVLSIPSSSTSSVRLLHLSFRDFLVDREKRETNPFWVDEQQTHERLAAHCLRVIKGCLRPDICGLRAPGTPRSSISAETVEANLPSELQYACLYWVYHVEQSKVQLCDGDQVHGFLCNYFLQWLEALSIIGRASESIGIIQTLQSLVEVNTQLFDFLDDAQRIVLANTLIINSSPLQLYSSVLAFTPQRSIVRGKFEKMIPDWINLRPEPETNWSQCQQTLEGHTQTVTSVAFSHDSALIASASSDKTVRLWRRDTGECVQELVGHGDPVTSVAFSHDSVLIASASSDKTVRLWRRDTGKCVQELVGHGDSVTSVAFSHDSVLIASGSLDCTVRLWRYDKGNYKCEQELDDNEWMHSMEVTVAFSHDSAFVASICGQNMLRFWRCDTGEGVQRIEVDSYDLSGLAFSHDSTVVASALADTVLLWRRDTDECVQELKDHGGAVNSVAFSFDTDEFEQELEGHSNPVTSVAFSHDSALIASASSDKTVRLWSRDTGECEQERLGHDDYVSLVVFSHDSALAASASRDGTVRLWRYDTGECEQVLVGHTGFVGSVAFSYDSALVASASYDGTVRVWRRDTGECVQELKGHGGSVSSVAFSPDSALVASASLDNMVSLWRCDTGECEQVLTSQDIERHDGSYSSVAFSHDSVLVASTCVDETVRIWRCDKGNYKCVQELKGHGGWVTSVALSPDSALVASASFDQTVRIWRCDTGECVQELVGHRVTSVALSHDSALVASASWDKTVRVWRCDTGECVQEENMGAVAMSLSFEPDGSRLLTSLGAIALPDLPKLPCTGHAAAHPVSAPPVGTELRNNNRVGYGFSRDRSWITWYGQNLLWLPVEFRPGKSAVSGCTVVIGCSSGRVIFIRFDTEAVNRCLGSGVSH